MSASFPFGPPRQTLTTTATTIIVAIATTVVTMPGHGAEKNGDALRRWAAAALLGQEETGPAAAGPAFLPEFPVTFRLATRKIDPATLPFLELLQQDHGTFGRGKSVVETPLQLGSTPFPHGLGTHSVSAVRVLLDRPASRFTAQVGVNAGTSEGSVVFAVELAGKEVFRSNVCRGGGEPVPMDVDLHGGKEFLLRVFDAGDGPTCDWASWCDAKVVYQDATSRWLDELPVYTPDSDACCVSVPSSELLPKWKRTHTVDPSADFGELHNVTYTDRVTGLKVGCDVRVFKDFSAVEWLARFTNTGSEDTPIIEDVLPMDVRIAGVADKAVLHYAHGSAAEVTKPSPTTLAGYDFQPYEAALDANAEHRFDATKGSSTYWLPFFRLDWNGGGLAWAVGWSGRWQMDVARDAQNQVTLKAGQKLIRTTLHPGESIRTPRMLLLSWQGTQRMQGANQWRRLLLAHYLPQYKGELQMTPVAADICTAGHPYRDTTETNSLAFIDTLAKIGGEVFWLDAGWYGPGIWTAGPFGTWDPHPSRFPNGLKPIGDAAHARGLKFLVWFWEQSVSPGSDIATKHPEWVTNGVYDLSNPDARKWLTECISTRIKDWGIDIYRHDGGLTYLAGRDAPDRQGITENHAIEGWYAHWDELLARHPGLWIDNCAGGGQNIDLETMMRSLPYTRTDGDPLAQPDATSRPSRLTMNQVQIAGLTPFVPLHGSLLWNNENPYWFRSVATTGFGYIEDITSPAFNIDQAKANIDELKSLRELWLGDFYPLSDVNLDDAKWCAWECYRPDLGKGFVMVFRRDQCSQTEFPLKLEGLDPDSEFNVTFVDEKRTQTMKAGELSHMTVALPAAAPGSLISALIVFEKAAN